MKLRGWLASILGIVYLCFLALCSFSGPLNKDSPLAFFNSNIYLSSGGFPEDTTDIAAVIVPEDLSVLEQFESLRSVDFSGSQCYDEINAWAETHPNVSVKYTVPLPCGVTADNSATELDMSAITDGDIAALEEALPALPLVKSVSLGSGTPSEHLSYELLSSMVAANPSISFSYHLSVLGQQVTLNDTNLNLSAMGSQDMDDILSLLKCMPELKTVVLGQEGATALSLEDIAQIVSARNDIDYTYTGTVFGVNYSLTDTVLDLNHITMDDGGKAVRRVISCMNKLETLDMDYCGVSNEDMATIRNDFPNVDVIWRVWFGGCYSVRTDAVKILASKPSVAGSLTNGDVQVLQYCTKIKYLDLGHNGDGGGGVTDISFVSHMPDLEVFIIAMNEIYDLSPLKDCPKLEYLDLLSTPISDLSPIANSQELKHIRIQEMPNLTDLSPLCGIAGLERVWLDYKTPVSQEQIDSLKAALPNCNVNTTGDISWTLKSYDAENGVSTWVPRYKLLREQFGYDTQEYSFYWLDPKCGDPAPAQWAGKFGKDASPPAA